MMRSFSSPGTRLLFVVAFLSCKGTDALFDANIFVSFLLDLLCWIPFVSRLFPFCTRPVSSLPRCNGYSNCDGADDSRAVCRDSVSRCIGLDDLKDTDRCGCCASNEDIRPDFCRDFDRLVDARFIQDAVISGGEDKVQSDGNMMVDSPKGLYEFDFNVTIRESGLISLADVDDLIESVSCRFDNNGAYVEVVLSSGVEFGSIEEIFPVDALLVVKSASFGSCVLKAPSEEDLLAEVDLDGFLAIESLEATDDGVLVTGTAQQFFAMFQTAVFAAQKATSRRGRDLLDVSFEVDVGAKFTKDFNLARGAAKVGFSLDAKAFLDVEKLKAEFGIFDGFVLDMDIRLGYGIEAALTAELPIEQGSIITYNEIPFGRLRLPWSLELPTIVRKIVNEVFEDHDLPSLRFGAFFEIPLGYEFDYQVVFKFGSKWVVKDPTAGGFRLKLAFDFGGDVEYSFEGVSGQQGDEKAFEWAPESILPSTDDFKLNGFIGLVPQLKLDLFGIGYIAYKKRLGAYGESKLSAVGFKNQETPLPPRHYGVCDKIHLLQAVFSAGLGKSSFVSFFDFGPFFIDKTYDLDGFEITVLGILGMICAIEATCDDTDSVCEANEKCCDSNQCIPNDSCCAVDSCTNGGNCCASSETQCCKVTNECIPISECCPGDSCTPSSPESPPPPPPKPPSEQPPSAPTVQGPGAPTAPEEGSPTASPIEVVAFASGSSTGDPHITTYDNTQYDCQGDGEFVLTRSETSGMQIQVRFTRTNPSLYPTVTTGFAVVEQAGGSVIQISIGSTPTESSTTINTCPVNLFVDGIPQSIGTGYSKNENFRLARRLDRLYLVFTNTELTVEVRIWVSETFGCYLNVVPNLPESYFSETFVGLLGSLNGDGTDDFMDSSGNELNLTALDILPSTWCTQYWCLRDETESLFIYEGGTSFADVENCDSGFVRPDYDFSSAPPELISLCGGNIACLIDGLEGGIADAQATLQAQIEAIAGGRLLPLCFETKQELQNAIRDYRDDNAPDTLVAILYGWPIGAWCVSAITDFSYLFFNTDFNEEVGDWDVSAGENFEGMFQSASNFNQALFGWVTSNATNMKAMFKGAEAFNQNLSGWQTDSVTDMSEMFYQADIFNGNISNWQTGSVQFIEGMFVGTRDFNQDLSTWSVGRITSMKNVFNGARSFNQSLSDWDLSQVTDITSMFRIAEVFDQDLSSWNTSKVLTMTFAFEGAAAFNGDVSTWSVSAVLTMERMFASTMVFNQDLTSWNPLSCSNFRQMFLSSSFNGDISTWTVSSGRYFRGMFRANTAFNQDLSSWNMSAAEGLESMFEDATSFNGDVSGWAVGAVENARFMFRGASAFSRNLCSWGSAWQVPSFSSSSMFLGTSCDLVVSPRFLLTAGAGPFCSDCSVGITEPLCFDSNEVLREAVEAYEDNNEPDSYVAKVFGWPIGSWCVNPVRDFSRVFSSSSLNEDISGWDVSNGENFASMFSGASNFNIDISTWSMEKATDMSNMFASSAFNQDLAWSTSLVTTMYCMFCYAPDFNGDIIGFDTGNVIWMSYMFESASAFNRDISGWNVSAVTEADNMFADASSFNHDLCAWGTAWQGREDLFLWSMFDGATQCPSTDSPDLSLETPGPFCFIC